LFPNPQVDDQLVLPNLPYLADDDEQFIDSLLDHYDQKVHGNRDENAGFLNDQMFFELCNRLTSVLMEKSTSPKKSGLYCYLLNYLCIHMYFMIIVFSIGTGSSTVTPFPPEVVFEAISDFFSDRGTAKDVRSKYY